MVKPVTTTKRIEEITNIQERIRKLTDEFRSDFDKPNALDSVIEKDLKAAVGSLELLMGFYKSKTDKKA